MRRAITLPRPVVTLAPVDANKKALDQVSAAYNDLQSAYNNGVLYAPVSGYIGANVAMGGAVLSGGKDRIANILPGLVSCSLISLRATCLMSRRDRRSP